MEISEIQDYESLSRRAECFTAFVRVRVAQRKLYRKFGGTIPPYFTDGMAASVKQP